MRIVLKRRSIKENRNVLAPSLGSGVLGLGSGSDCLSPARPFSRPYTDSLTALQGRVSPSPWTVPSLVTGVPSREGRTTWGSPHASFQEVSLPGPPRTSLIRTSEGGSRKGGFFFLSCLCCSDTLPSELPPACPSECSVSIASSGRSSMTSLEN